MHGAASSRPGLWVPASRGRALTCGPFSPADSKGLSNPAEVEALREKVYASLEAYCKHKYPEQPGRWALGAAAGPPQPFRHSCGLEGSCPPPPRAAGDPGTLPPQQACTHRSL